MNSWQINFIHQNLPSLINVTRCTVSLNAQLLSKGFLSTEDVDTLTTAGSSHGEIHAAEKLYTIMKTKTNAFIGLMEALHKTRQTGAWNIFQAEIRAQLSTFPVMVSGHKFKLNELFPSWTDEDSKDCLNSEDTLNEFCKLLSDDAILLDIDKAVLSTNPHPLYIPRFVSNRILLNAAVFQQNCEDTFAFTGVDKLDLVKLVDPYPVRSSSEQVTLITCRHIYLENAEDWDDLRDVAKTPLHLISKEKFQFVLQRSTQITNTILNHTNGLERHEAAYISEDKFVEEILTKRDTKGICVCDIPGMGKTWLLESVTSKLQKLSTRTLVMFVQLSPFAKSLGELSKSLQDPFNYIFETLASSKLVSFILQRHAKKSGLGAILILDGFDEVREDYVEITTKFLKQLIAEDNVRLVISSRPHMRKHLEKTFKVISYDILPFGREEQVCAIVGRWQLSLSNCESKLREYAKQCIRVFRDVQCDDSKNILGVPLKCYILAEVNYKYAQQLARSKKGLKVAEEAVINSISDLYEKFVESRISKVLGGTNSGRMIKRISFIHTHQAMNLLLPELITPLMRFHFYSETPLVNITEVVKLGIMSLDNNSELVFLHRSFAEYFVGKFFAEFWKNLGEFEHHVVRSVGHYFLKTMLNSTSDPSNVYTNTYFSFNPHKKKLRHFTNRALLWFLNSMYHKDTTILPRFREILLLELFPNETNYNFIDFKIMLKKEAFNILIACIDEKFRAILSLFLQILQVFFEPCELFEIFNEDEYKVPLLLYRTALSGFPETAHKIFQIFSYSSEENYLLSYCDKFPLEYNSPVEVAIDRNHIDMFDYLHKKVKVPGERLIFRCLFGENLSPTNISKRVEIFGRILAENQNNAWAVSTQDFKVYLESLTENEDSDVTQLIGFAFYHNLSLCELPRSNKVDIVIRTLTKVEDILSQPLARPRSHSRAKKSGIPNWIGDIELFQLLHLLFVKSGSLRQVPACNAIMCSSTKIRLQSSFDAKLCKHYCNLSLKQLVDPQLYFILKNERNAV